ncbi:ABC transporter ATP-binding protein/permease [Phaeacidiphilus oryzae]|uniref:ABC transporter ATP-binding protein/permease n=1 Tax=Phaeacidiphilus oryzae TaxID=348818 RepID=UPI0007C67A85|nr:ATP-binding cassette domain-containing protein [Phaeacidiphilus oryzae]
MGGTRQALAPSRARTPLPWLGGLLALYLLLPVALFLLRFGRAAGSGSGSSLSAPGVGDALLVSVETASIATGVVAVLGVPLAYVLARARGRLAGLIGVAVQLPLALPPLMSGILLLYVVGPYSALGGFFARFGWSLTDSRIGIVLAQVFVEAPFLVIAARSSFAAADRDLADVAATLGHGPWSRFARVALPGALGGIRAGLLLAWLRAFGEFGATVILAYHPSSLPVFTYVQFGSTGLDSTLVPVAVCLAAAVVVLTLSQIGVSMGRARRLRRTPALPEPRAPRAAPATALPSFELAARAGGFDLAVNHPARGRHLAILGPSGAGKSLTLRLLAGLAPLASGRIRLGDEDLTPLPPERRGIGYLPQDACLLPHLTVWQQITFGVGTDPAVAAHWLHRLGLAELAGRLPHQLSGGQRRRVALARALAREPRLLLLDEPFTGLDTPVRDELRRELRRLQREGAAPATVLVTHDPEEAALLADDVLLVSDGRLLQSGPQEDVFARPSGPRSARLLGLRNLLPGRVSDGELRAAGGVALPLGAEAPADGEVTWCIRPEDVRLTADGGQQARVLDRVRLGPLTELTLLVGGELELAALTPAPPGGDTVRIDLPPRAVTIWPSAPAHPRVADTSPTAAP